MTYGEHAAQVRESMATLLSWHRIQQRLGGGGNPTLPATTTAVERERMGQIIQRYRLSALTWCLQAITATTPNINAPPDRWRPAAELRRALDAAVTAATRHEPLTDLLAVHHDNHLLSACQAPPAPSRPNTTCWWSSDGSRTRSTCAGCSSHRRRFPTKPRNLR